MTPKVSVLIPVYNGERFIQRCVKSVVDQTLAAIEIIVVDNQSADATWDILAAFEHHPKVKLYRNSTNIGMFPNFNRALSFSRGQFVKFLCADDFLEPNAIEVMLSAMEGSPDVGLVRAYAQNLTSDERLLGKEKILKRGVVDGSEIIWKSVLFMTNRYCNTPSHLMLRREDLIAVGCYPEIDDFHGWWNDAYACLRILQNKKIAFLDKYLLNRTIHEGQPTNRVYQDGLLHRANQHFRAELRRSGLVPFWLNIASQATCLIGEPILRAWKLRQRQEK